MSAWAAIYSDFSHRYDNDRDQALIFTLGIHDRPPEKYEEFCRCLASDPVAVQPFIPRKPPSPAVLAFRRERKREHLAETAFWLQELKTATARKFLPVLRAEKAKSTDLPGTRKITWVFVHYGQKTLNLGMFEWVVGNKRPYVKFTKAKTKYSFYH